MALVFNPFTGNFDNIIASSSEMSMSDGTLTVNGEINLDEGGAFSTTVQAVTPTANRTISFPDATGTVALVNGANGTIQYNDAGTLKGNSDFTVDPDWNNASTVFTGLKLNVTDTASASGSKSVDIQVNGTSIFKILDTIPTYADQAAATGGGLSAGDIYKTSAGSLQIVY